MLIPTCTTDRATNEELSPSTLLHAHGQRWELAYHLILGNWDTAGKGCIPRGQERAWICGNSMSHTNSKNNDLTLPKLGS